MKRLSGSVDTLIALGDPVLVVVGEEEEKNRKPGQKVRVVGAVFMQQCDGTRRRLPRAATRSLSAKIRLLGRRGR